MTFARIPGGIDISRRGIREAREDAMETQSPSRDEAGVVTITVFSDYL